MFSYNFEEKSENFPSLIRRWKSLLLIQLDCLRATDVSFLMTSQGRPGQQEEDDIKDLKDGIKDHKADIKDLKWSLAASLELERPA